MTTNKRKSHLFDSKTCICSVQGTPYSQALSVLACKPGYYKLSQTKTKRFFPTTKISNMPGGSQNICMHACIQCGWMGPKTLVMPEYPCGSRLPATTRAGHNSSSIIHSQNTKKKREKTRPRSFFFFTSTRSNCDLFSLNLCLCVKWTCWFDASWYTTVMLSFVFCHIVSINWATVYSQHHSYS